MDLSKQVFILFVLFQFHSGFAQWHILPDVPPSTGNQIAPIPPPTIVSPVSNGKIFFGNYKAAASSTGGSSVSLLCSENDISSYGCIACPFATDISGTFSSINEIGYFNDSTLIINTRLVTSYLKFTFNNFKKTFALGVGQGIAPIRNSCITNRHVYYTSYKSNVLYNPSNLILSVL